MSKEDLFELVFEVVNKGIVEVLEKKSKERVTLFRGYTNYPTISYRKNGFPSIFKSPYGSDSVIDYEKYFKTNPNSDNDKIDITKFAEYIELKNLILQCDKYIEIYSPGDEDKLGLLDYSILNQVINLITKVIHEFGEENTLTKEQLIKLYQPLENRVLFKDLYVDIYIPILFTKFKVKEHKLTDSISIVEMSEVFQKSRSQIESFSEGIPEPVLMSATHALKLENYWIENMNRWTGHPVFGDFDRYPLEQINAFFNTLRVNNFLTGYAQMISSPINWTEGYTADLLDLKGISVRMYPVEFNNYYWNKDAFPIVDEVRLKEIQMIFKELVEKEYKKINLACSRLENSFYRKEEGDKIVDIAIGLESLLSDKEKGEITYKLSLRAAYLLQFSSLGDSKLDVFNNMKAIYTYRSAIVHGQNQKNLERKRYIENVEGDKKLVLEVAEIYLKECIKVLIHKPEFLDATVIDKKLILL
ncbi:HEPN domain-containing protein [Bacillus cereus]|uniref:HEPN domain-containing protein n=1 Tax=Bacillus cereus TaxID=1396 RepID=UPI000BF36A4F|nr:HEPN domain-containing protein [Bacillus cereus]PFA02699.1 hypothetical protein CN382_30015 [Bacillus cereus]